MKSGGTSETFVGTSHPIIILPIVGAKKLKIQLLG